MSMSQSKLMLQLTKQQKVQQKVPFNQQKIQDLYTTISKLQPKNLMLVQFLTLMIQKNVIKNSHKIQTFVDMYQQIKGKKLQQQHNSFSMMNNKSANNTSYSNNSVNLNTNSSSVNNNSSSLNNTQYEKQQQKFNKKKFIKLLKDVAKLLYPGDSKSYQSTLYLRLIMPEQEQNRMKVDDNVKKFLNEQVIKYMSKFNKQIQALFQVYMPQNYNNKLSFNWNQIRLLQKKLPIICLLRILFQSQICPQYLSPVQFLQIINKMIPPLNSNHKEVMFYYSQTFNNYMKDSIFQQEIKLLEGDIGLTCFQFTIVLIRIATEVWKDAKQQITKAIDKLFNHFAIAQLIKNKKQFNKMTKLQTVVLNHFKQTSKTSSNINSNNKCLKKKTYFKKDNQQLLTLLDQAQNQNNKPKTAQSQLPYKKLQHQSMLITKDDLTKIKRNLDDQLGPIPEKIPIDKQNEGYFNVNQKFTVIGEQLPKLQQKNKPVAKPNPKDKKQDPLFGFKPEEQPKLQNQSKSSLLLNRKKKLRLNTEHPVILSQVFYPTSFSDPNLIKLKQQQEIYLQTTYIHLGQRMYEQAYLNFQKAERLIKAKKPGTQMSTADKKVSLMMEFYLQILQAQIFQSAGKDQAALVHYYNAREISFNFQASQVAAKAYTYMGLSSTLYHLEEYQFALRCLLKAKQIYGESLQTQSIQNAILLNNIGSCYMMLNRNQQAVKYFNVGHQIFDLKVGRFDQRTLVVQQNISKNKKAFIEQMPSFKTMWKTYVQKSTTLTTAKSTKKVKK